MEDSLTTPGVKEPELSSLKRMFEDSASLTDWARKQSQIDRDYFDGYQWTPGERQALRARSQPDNVFNRVRPAIEGTVGVIEQGQTDPRAWSRNPQDEDAAEVATKTLRYIEDRADFDQTKTEQALQFFIEGICAVIVEMDGDEVDVQEIRFEEFFFDPRSRKKDFSDARYLGIAKWRYADEVTSDPDKKAQVEAVIAGAQMGDDTFDDRPRDGSTSVAWVDKRKRRVMVVEVYYKEDGEWMRCVFHSGGILDSGVSSYRDRYGTRCPIIAASCYIDRENNRYGKVRDMRGPQDEINKRRSKLLHLLSVSQIQAVDPSAVEVNADEARKEAAKPDGVIPFGWQKVQTADVAAGQAQLLTEAKAEIERMGPNPAILGRQGESSSGRAQLVRQQAGLTELAPALGVFDRWVLRVYRAMWETARQFWRAPKWIRITDDQQAPEYIGLNQYQVMIDPVTQQQVQVPVMGRDGQPLPANDIGQMDVDITIDSTPDTANVAQEQFLALVELAKSGVQIPPQILIEASSLPKKREIVEQLQAMSSQPDPKSQIDQAQAAADVQETQAKTALTTAQAQNEFMQGAAMYQGAPMLMPAAAA